MPSLAHAKDPEQLHEVLVAATARITALGATVTYSRLPPRSLYRWCPRTTTLHLRDTADLVDIVWALNDFWWLHTVGEHASHAHRSPHLTPVDHTR